MRQKWIIIPLNKPLLSTVSYSLLGEVIGLFRYDVAYSSAGVVDIAGIARDYVKMKMQDRLSGRRPKIETNIEAIGRMASSNSCNRLVDCRPSPSLLDIGQFSLSFEFACDLTYSTRLASLTWKAASVSRPLNSS